MSSNSFKDIIQNFTTSAQALSKKVDELSKDPETQNLIKGFNFYIQNHDKTDPLIKQLISEMENNPNLSEALEILSYGDIYKLLFNNGEIKEASVLTIINKDYFQKELLNYFDEIKINNKFLKRKFLIQEALKLYEIECYAGCLCLLHSQLEGIITDYLLHKNILTKSTDKYGKPCFKETINNKQITGLRDKIKLSKTLNNSFIRLENYKFDSDADKKFHNERNNILHGSNIDSFTYERCFIVFIWIASLLGSIYNEQLINSLSKK
jgi:hypothetical protein